MRRTVHARRPRGARGRVEREARAALLRCRRANDDPGGVQPPDTNLPLTLLIVDELEETFLNLDRDQLLSILPTVRRWLGTVEPSFQATTLFTVEARVRRQDSEQVGVVRNISININSNGRSVIYTVDFGGGQTDTVNEEELVSAGVDVGDTGRPS